jgi:pimeloyl-ACP methyl ester carboxylesterase
MPDKAHPVVFIHGLWLHATSWEPWEPMFEQAGYKVVAPGWPGDQETVSLARADPDSVADQGIDDVVEHFASVIAGLDATPVLIGHSFGGMIAEKLLGQDRAAAAIAIDAAQIKGVLPLPLSSLRSTLPVFRNPANRHRAVMLTAEQFRYGAGGAHRRHQVEGERRLPVLVRDLAEPARPGRSSTDVVDQDVDPVAGRSDQHGRSAGFREVYLHNPHQPGSR